MNGGVAIRGMRAVLALLAAAAAVILIWTSALRRQKEDAVSIPDPEIVYTGEDFVMDTFVTQKVWDEDGEELILAVNALFHDLEDAWSAYEEGSVPAGINAMAGVSPQVVSAGEFEIIEKVYDFSVKTEGRFDLTIAPLVKLWGISSGQTEIPAAGEISAALSYVGLDGVHLDSENSTVFLDRPGMELDFGGSLKGYAVEQALAYYQQSGVQGALVSLGGNVAATGKKPSEGGGTEDFSIGLRDPEGSASDYYGVLRLNDRVICTSGGYERYFEKDGKRYHHILDPQTGYPAETDLLAVTVIGEDGLLCDCLSTWLYMEGLDNVKAHLNETDYSVIAVDNDRQIWLSPSLKEAFTLREDSGYRMADE